MRSPGLLLRLVLGSAFSLSIASTVYAQDREAEALRAALVFNIIRFVDFPSRPHDAPLLLCVAKGSSHGTTLASLAGRRIGEQAIDVRLVPEGTIGDCNILYLEKAVSADIARLEAPGLLLIGEGPNFISDGGMIGLVKTGRQIRFEINVRSARRYRVNISSQLLRLASRVQQ